MANLKACGEAPQLSCLANLIPVIINLAFVFLGAACVIFLLWGSIRFITSGGDQKAVQGAKATITYAIIGTVLVLSAFILANLFGNLFVAGGSTALFTK
jgi:hypothetical protein